MVVGPNFIPMVTAECAGDARKESSNQERDRGKEREASCGSACLIGGLCRDTGPTPVLVPATVAAPTPEKRRPSARWPEPRIKSHEPCRERKSRQFEFQPIWCEGPGKKLTTGMVRNPGSTGLLTHPQARPAPGFLFRAASRERDRCELRFRTRAPCRTGRHRITKAVQQ